MEVINEEIFITSLISLGFDKIDNLFFNLTLNRLFMNEENMKKFIYKIEKPSEIFYKYIDYDGLTYKLKDDYADIKALNDIKISNTLIDALSKLDYETIILRKLKIYGKDNKMSNRFYSEKEKSIINTCMKKCMVNNNNRIKKK